MHAFAAFAFAIFISGRRWCADFVPRMFSTHMSPCKFYAATQQRHSGTQNENPIASMPSRYAH
jgi:hypothetical protein